MYNDVPVSVGTGSPYDHDYEEDEGKQNMPETLSQPHLPPVLETDDNIHVCTLLYIYTCI